MQTDLDAAHRRLATYTRSDDQLNRALADGYRSAEKVIRRARLEADEILDQAMRERRVLASDLARLHEERDELHDELAEVRRGGLVELPRAVEAEAPRPVVIESAVAEEMRALLMELIAQVRTAPAAPVATVAPEPAAIAPEPASPPPVASAQVIEHVEELLRPADLTPVVELPTAPAPPEIAAAAPESQPAAIVDEDVFEPAMSPVTDAADVIVPKVAEAAPSEPAPALEPTPPLVDEEIIEPRVPEIAMWPRSSEVETPPAQEAGSIESEDLLDLREAASRLVEDALSVEPPVAEPAATELVEAPPAFVEPVSPVAPPDEAPTDRTIGAEEPPAADPRIADLWESVAPTTTSVPSPDPFASAPIEPAPADVAPSEPVLAEPAPTDPISFITESFIEETRAPAAAEFASEVSPVAEPEPPVTSEPEVRTIPADEEERAAIYADVARSIASEPGLREIQVVISPIHSFPRLIETERRIRALSTVNALQLRDFRNGVATFAIGVSEAISPAEFGAVIQMLQDLHLRLEGTSQSTVELHAEDDPPAS